MTRYALAWQPSTDNLGDDLRVLAASRLLPRVDMALDVDRLEEPVPGLAGDDRVVTVLSGPLLQRSAHWPPNGRIAPVCVGVHVSEEDVWGLPFTALDGAGRAYLEQCAPIGCRDDRTMRLMEALHIPHELTACLTLTLERPDVPEGPPYICCVDVPESATSALEAFAPGVGVAIRSMTHRLENPGQDFASRMRHAEEVLQAYAGAQFVVTRRLHCAMACLAIGTPVILLYNPVYEDITKFSPMDGMMHIRSMEEFVTAVQANGFPVRWKNPQGIDQWRMKLRDSFQQAVMKAEQIPLPMVSEQEAAAWREARLHRIMEAGEEKLLRLERERYEGLHEKFSLLLREDALKSLLSPLLKEPEIIRALQRIDARRNKASKRNAAQGEQEAPAELRQQLEEALRELGWPEQ